jgi:hypothetical protein
MTLQLEGMINVDVWLIPLAGMAVPVLVVAIIFAFVYKQRQLVHQERLAMIEKGLLPENLKDMELPVTVSPARSLQSGIVTASIGLALLLGLGTIGYGPWLLGGLIPLAVGIGQIISYVIATNDKNKTEYR